MAKNDFQYGGWNYYTEQRGTIMTLISPDDCVMWPGLFKCAVLNKFVQFYSLKCAVGNLANGPFAKLPTAHFSE